MATGLTEYRYVNVLKKYFLSRLLIPLHTKRQQTQPSNNWLNWLGVNKFLSTEVSMPPYFLENSRTSKASYSQRQPNHFLRSCLMIPFTPAVRIAALAGLGKRIQELRTSSGENNRVEAASIAPTLNKILALPVESVPPIGRDWMQGRALEFASDLLSILGRFILRNSKAW